MFRAGGCFFDFILRSRGTLRVDFAVNKFNALPLKQGNLHIFAREGKCGRCSAEAVNHAIARDMLGIRINVERVAYHLAPPRISRHGCPWP